MLLTVIVTFFLLQSIVLGEDGCPQKYLRLSQDHSFCRPPNSQCNFVSRGLQDEEIDEILRVHNEYRSKVATGSERKAGGLPEASNMLELTWDTELAEIAQKWAEQCKFDHDCAECRSVRAFGVGQNIAYSKYYCKGKCELKKSKWYDVVGDWYSEVADFDKKLVPSIEFTGAVIGHFTQVAWADTYKVGCGYVVYKQDEDFNTQFYVCNYGPKGNTFKKPLYEIGTRCSNCPKNSCCDGTCQGQTFPGLCQLSDGNSPIYIQPNLLFHCGFEEGDPNCEFDSGSGDMWEIVKTSGGNLLSGVVKEGKTSTVHFLRSIASNQNACMMISFRKGPSVAGEKDEISLEVEFEQNGQKYPMQVWTYPWADFIEIPVQVNYDGNIKFSIKTSVPTGATSQYIDIKQINIIDEPCKYGN